MGRRISLLLGKIKPNKLIMSWPLARVILFNILLVSFCTLGIFMIINNDPSLKGNILAQSMLLISVLSALCASLLYRIKKGEKWWKSLLNEMFFSLIFMLANLCVIYTFLQLFSFLNQNQQTAWSVGAFDFPTIFLIGISSLLYLFFRFFFYCWYCINDLRKRNFSWALTYYFLIVVTITVAVFIVLFIIATITLTGNSIQLTGSDFLGRSLDWLVFTFLPVSALVFAFLFGTITVLILPAALFSRFFTKKITGRLDHLRMAASALRGGDYQARSPIEGRDEIAQLQEDFNNMAENLELSIDELNNEKKLVNDLLEERRELIASVSHELRTPITTILNYLEAIKKRIKKKRDKELQNNIEIISQEINRLNLIINDLFDLSRAEIGKLTIRSEACQIEDIVHQVVGTYKPLAWKSRHVDLVSQVEEALPDLISDSNRIIQILSNLIRNAIQHTRPGGIVQIGAGLSDGKLAITVTDTGEGIPEDELPHIWKRFYKGQQTSSGNGIGLSVVKELTELMDGEIRVQSELGVGSQFEIIFPLAPKKKARKEKSKLHLP